MTEDRYIKQRQLKIIGNRGQELLGKSKAVIIGLGGLGSVIAMELARAGVGFLRLVDSDIVEVQNLHRQILYTLKDAENNRYKTDAAKEHLLETNPDLKIESFIEKANENNILSLIKGMDVVLDATDNLQTRYIINEACVKLGIPWVYGGVSRTRGSVFVFQPGGPCLTCMTGKTEPSDNDRNAECISRNSGILGTVPIATASIEATEAIKLITKSSNVKNEVSYFDLWENTSLTLPVKKNEDCPICSQKKYRYIHEKD